MKRIWALVLIAAMVVTLAACGGQKGNSSASTGNAASGNTTQTTTQTNTQSATQTTTETPVKRNPAADNFIPGTSSLTPNYATISILPEIKLEREDAWLGLCPAGVDYITEEEADAEDVIYFYPDYKENASDKTVYSCDFEGVEDGTYALVVCTSDDAEIGYVIIQMDMTIENGKLTFDLENAVLKEDPRK